MIHLITQFYKVKYKNTSKDLLRKRQNEITYCFKKNLAHKAVKKIHFLYESEDDVNFLEKEGIDIVSSDKIILYNLGSRIKYSDIFEYANKNLKNEICVYLHADMCLDTGFNLLNKESYNSNKVYALTSHNPNRCNRQIICRCTRQYQTPKGWYCVTFDGFVFKAPIKNEVIKKANHIVHIMGAENRMIDIFKENNYEVVSPNNILMAFHHHNIKIFAKKHSYWINREGELKSLDFYSKIHSRQSNLPYEKKIVGGGIPFYNGSAEIVDKL